MVPLVRTFRTRAPSTEWPAHANRSQSSTGLGSTAPRTAGLHEYDQHYLRDICGLDFSGRHVAYSQHQPGQGLQSGLRITDHVPGLRLHHAAVRDFLQKLWKANACSVSEMNNDIHNRKNSTQ